MEDNKVLGEIKHKLIEKTRGLWENGNLILLDQENKLENQFAVSLSILNNKD